MNREWATKVEEERKELCEKLRKLYQFMASEEYNALGYTQILLQDQRDAMEDYLQALNARLLEYNREGVDTALEGLV